MEKIEHTSRSKRRGRIIALVVIVTVVVAIAVGIGVGVAVTQSHDRSAGNDRVGNPSVSTSTRLR